MKFFVDTADVAEIRDLAATGLLDGVTTNPSLIAKSGRDFFEVVAEICALVDGPVSAEVAATEAEAMVAEGRKSINSASIKATIAPMIRPKMRVVTSLFVVILGFAGAVAACPATITPPASHAGHTPNGSTMKIPSTTE